MRRIERLPTPQGIGPGQTATLNLPLGTTYNRFDIRCNAQIGGAAKDLAAADWGTVIGDIRLLVDGNTKIEATADYLVKRAQFYGQTLEPGVLPIFLAQPWARTVLGEDISAYGTNGGMASFTMEIDIKDAQTVNSLRVFADQSPGRPFGKHLVIRRFAKSFAASGIDEVADIPRGAHNLLGLDITDADVADIEVFAGGSDGQSNRVHVSDAPIRQQDHLIAGRVKQAGMTHIDFIPKDRIAVAMGDGSIQAEALPMALSDFRVKLTFTSAPGTYAIYETTLMG